MPLDVLIARWVAVMWLICGLSHAFYPAKWSALLVPLKDRETGGFILAAMSLPFGLVIILGHNIWGWDFPVIVTVAGWLTTFKSVAYLLFPRAHMRVMYSSEHMVGGSMEKAFRFVGVIMFVLGLIAAYDSFFQR